MAAPSNVTIKDLGGKWVMNKTLSDDTDALLALQGVGWFTRKAISMATVTLHIKQYAADDDGVTHIDIDQTLTGGIKGTNELRTLDWTFREHSDHLFGNLKGRSRWVTIENTEITDPWLKEGWLEGNEENGGPSGERHIESFVDNEEKGWTGEQIWGFSLVGEERYYTRRVVVAKGEEVLKVRLYYNWQGEE